jgi:protein-tyrosine phosphatase
MQHRGLDLSGHRARQASREQLSQSDLILVLDRGHKQWLSSNFPHLVGRIFKLGFWNGDIDVDDPYCRPYEAFQRAGSDIERHVDSWVNKIRRKP